MAEMEKVAEAMVEAIRAAEEELGEEDSDASEPDSQ
jgi:hypothetical protein